MIWNRIWKNPALTIGILMMAIFLLDYTYRDDGLFRRKKFVAYSCNAVVVKLKKSIPKTWKIACEENNLAVTIQRDDLAQLKKLSPDSQKGEIQKIIYRDLANQLTFITQFSPNETLERVDIIKVRIYYPMLTLNAVTEGKYMGNLISMKDTDNLARHLMSTVQVQEVWK